MTTPSSLMAMPSRYLPSSTSWVSVGQSTAVGKLAAAPFLAGDTAVGKLAALGSWYRLGLASSMPESG